MEHCWFTAATPARRRLKNDNPAQPLNEIQTEQSFSAPEYNLAMATAAQIPLSEYLSTTYRPDREYVDGELRERNVGKWEHARVQNLLAHWFTENQKDWQVFSATEARVQVRAGRIRIPDVVLTKPVPQPDVLLSPPVLVVEILSPDDTYSDTQERALDYMAMGVPMVWIIDPKTRSGRMIDGMRWTSAKQLEVPGTLIHVDLETIFSKIQQL